MPPAAPAALSAAAIQTPDCLPPARSSPVAASSDSAQAGLRAGSRVRIEGLQGAPEMNGRTGVLFGDFDRISGRWSVRVDADGARRACVGMFRPTNLKLVPSHNFSTEWLDEDGRVCPKNVVFSRQCSKGHPLALLGECGSSRDCVRLMCRLCHCFCERSSAEAAGWSVCSFDEDCCGGYAVCCSCAQLTSSTAVAPAGSDECSTLVSAGFDSFRTCRLILVLQGVALPYLSWLRTTLAPSLRRASTSQFCQMYVRPFTWRNRCSATQQLLAGEGARFVGEATWFVSHTWNNAFVDTLDAILLFFAGKPDASDAVVWFDVLVTSQHSVPGQSRPSSSWMATFKDSISRIGGLLLVVDAWENPTALRRAW
jgi:hypothetical protein